MATQTSGQIIADALSIIGVLDPDNTTMVQPSTYQTGLRVFNDMIDSWNQEQLLVYAENQYVFPFVPGTQIYTLGSTNPIVGSISGTILTTTSGTPTIGAVIMGLGILPLTTVLSGTGTSWILSNDCGTVPSEVMGCNIRNNFNIPRPARVTRWSVQYPAGHAYMNLPASILSVEEWQSITYNVAPSSFPTQMYNDTNYPYMNLYFYPVPESPCNALLFTWDQLQEVGDLNTNVFLPQGYNEAIKYNLAIRLSPYFGVEPSSTTIKIAMDSKSNINDINSGIPIATIDKAYVPSMVCGAGITSRGFYVP
jgi:hypothetical protein